MMTEVGAQTMRRASAIILSAALLAGCAWVPPARGSRAEPDRAGAPRTGGGAPAQAPPPEPAPMAPLTVAPESGSFEAKVLEKDPEGCTWVESEGAVTVSDRETPHQAEAAAIQEARSISLRKFLGVKVTSRFMSFKEETMRGQDHLVSDIVQATRPGREIDMRVLDKGYRSVPGCEGCRYYVRLRSCIVPEPMDADKDFTVELKVSREILYEGDEAFLEITPSKDCHIYLYDTYDAGKGKKQTDLLVPSEFLSEVRLRGGQAWVYPDEEAKKRGILALTAQLPPDKPAVSVEEIRVIASKTPLPVRTYDPKIPNPRQSDDSGRAAVLRRLNNSGVNWAEDSAAISIFQRK
ncbi:MAG: hypothetical protein HY748_07090 [Elusimicrobia bacterium]|nr:hypothetical protein [Elusimicrobiota bacterium]